MFTPSTTYLVMTALSGDLDRRLVPPTPAWRRRLGIRAR